MSDVNVCIHKQKYGGLGAGLPRGLGGSRANAKSGAPQNGLCEGGLGVGPQEILRFYML